MEERHYTEQEMVCDVCGTVADVVPLGRPEGWYSVQFTREGKTIAQDMCSWPCFYGWVEAEENPIDMKPWKESIKMLTKEIECSKCATKFDYDEGLASCPVCEHVNYVEEE